MQEYNNFEAEVMKKAEETLTIRTTQLLTELQKLQETFTKNSDLDSALAIRTKINELKIAQRIRGEQILPDIGTLKAFTKAAPREALIFRINGSTAGGTVWGTDLYTSDSNLAMAAVHVGVLTEGQEGLVKVTFAPGQESNKGSIGNGITSEAWGSYSKSFKMEPITP